MVFLAFSVCVIKTANFVLSDVSARFICPFSRVELAKYKMPKGRLNKTDRFDTQDQENQQSNKTVIQ